MGQSGSAHAEKAALKLLHRTREIKLLNLRRALKAEQIHTFLDGLEDQYSPLYFSDKSAFIIKYTEL